MSKTKRRVRLTNEELNSYGTRVLTSGMNISQFERNPVLLWMHQRGEVIGRVDEIQVENGEITGVLSFDEATELSQRCKKQFEFGSLRMVSVGIDIIEWSDEREHLLVGQTRPTITKSKLKEVSLVDIGANDDAIVLSYEGKKLELSNNGDCPLPTLSTLSTSQSKEMEQKALALSLGLPEGADEATIMAKLETLKASAAEADELRNQQVTLMQQQIEAVVEAAIAEKRIEETMKAHFVEMGKTIGVETLKTTFAAMNPRTKLSTVLNSAGSEVKPEAYTKLSDVPSDKLMELRDSNLELYKQLYKAEYNMECPL